MAYLPEYISCDWCQSRLKGNSIDAHAAGWDWYSDPETFHICPKCQKNTGCLQTFAARAQAAMQAQKKAAAR
jgi:hypothetical protein